MKCNTKLRHRILAGTMSALLLFGTVAASVADVKANGVALAESKTVVTSGSTTSDSESSSGTSTSSPVIKAIKTTETNSEFSSSKASGKTSSSDTAATDSNFVSGNRGEANVTKPATEDTKANTDSTKTIITKFSIGQEIQKAEGFDLDTEVAKMPTTVQAILEDGSTIDLPATWTPLDEDLATFNDDSQSVKLMSYYMDIPDGYALSDDCDTPEILLNFMPLRVANGEDVDDVITNGIPEEGVVYNSNSNDSGIATYSANDSGIATYSSGVTVDSWESSYGNLIIDSATRGKKISSKRFHQFNTYTDGDTDCFCYAQGHGDPNGQYDYEYIGDANESVASIIDHGWPNTCTYNGTTVNWEVARQATQVAIWCHTREYNKNSVRIALMDKSGRTGSADALAMAEYLENNYGSGSSDSVYEVWAPEDKTSGYQYVVSVHNSYIPIVQGYLYIQKHSTVSTSYSLAGAVYNVYADSACTSYVGQLTTGSDGRSTSYLTLDAGTYYIREASAPANFKLNATVYSGTITALNTCIVDTWDAPITGSVTIHKRSADTSVTNGNSNYSLKGARFRLYTSSGQTVTDVTTDANGNATISNLNPGSYYIKEFEASPGYEIAAGRYDFTIASGGHSDVAVTVNWSEPVALGYIELKKTSTMAELTDGKAEFKLSGAVYGVYSDSACNNQVTTMTTDESGYAKSKALPLGVYYVKEITPPANYKLDTNVYTVNTTSQQTVSYGTADGHDYTIARDSRGFESLSLGDVDKKYTSVKFAVWDKNDQSDLIWYSASLQTSGNSTNRWQCYVYPNLQSWTGYYNVHVYGYTSPTDRGTMIASMGHTINVYFDKTYSLDVQDEPNTGWVELNKASSNTSITDGNGCYTLAGAVYGIYSDENCTNEVTRITTDENGYAKSELILVGNYYVKEITAPDGYELDETVYPITIKPVETTTLDVEDAPANDPLGITLTKIQATPNHNLPPMDGAQFTVKYYDGQYDSVNDLPAEATRTWVIETKAETNGDKTVYMTLLTDTYKVDGDELYYDGDYATIPIGTITIEETKTALGFTLEGGYLTSGDQEVDSNGGKILLHITQNGINGGAGRVDAGNEYTKKEEPDVNSTITINKKGSDGKALAGAEFSLDIKNIETGEWEHLTDKTTDANGQIVFDNLIFGTYRVKEIKSPDGNTLLADPIIVTVPYSTEATVDGIEPSFTRDGVNYYYDLHYDVTNNATFNLPMTGGTYGMLPAIAGFAFVLIAGGVMMTLKHKRYVRK